MEYFDVPKIERQLLAINKANNIKEKAAVQIVINNMEIYNGLLEAWVHQNEQKNLYLTYQMSSTIFKQLREYGIVPATSEDLKKKKDGGDTNVGTFLKTLKKNKKKPLETRKG